MKTPLRLRFEKYLAQTSDFPMGVEIREAEGIWLVGSNGKKYLDLISGIAVSNCGHKCPEIVSAINEQSGKYMHAMVYGEYVLSPQVEYARALVEELGEGLDNVFFVNSGSEAVEGALKLAKKLTGRHKLISFLDSYHGSTAGALSVSGSPARREGFGPMLPEVSHIPINDTASLEIIDKSTAAVIIEPIQAESGIRIAQDSFLRKLRELCDENGAMLIFDESQTAMGRTGSLFRHQKTGVKPDILVLSKALGGGLPLGAFISSHENMKVLRDNPVLGHISTFGGHPLSCAAGLAGFNKIRNEKLHEHAAELEELIHSEMKHPLIQEVRGKGLFFAVQLQSFEQVSTVISYCMENGVLTDWFLHNDSAIRITPPLIITHEQLREGLQVLLRGIASLA